jgi:hypothetical protein
MTLPSDVISGPFAGAAVVIAFFFAHTLNNI